jgi:hypothetical protein
MITKLEISPEVQAFNDAVQEADALTDGQFDQEPACVLLDRLQQMRIYPYTARALAEAMAAIAVKR